MSEFLVDGGSRLTAEGAWRLLLAARRRPDSEGPVRLALDGGGEAFPVPPGAAEALLRRERDGRWHLVRPAEPALEALFRLYLPLCASGPGGDFVIAHLGQSLDGHIATASGDSCYVTGAENLRHLHRMRALADAVVVGAGTARQDDPRLTTRLVAGPNPVRVVIDPRRQLPATLRMLTDGAAPTLVVWSERPDESARDHFGQARVMAVADKGGELDLAALVRLLRARGLGRIFVEGGGYTVSALLGAGLLDRLQIAVAPLLIGSGRPGIRLPPIEALAQGLRPPCEQYRMGPDILFDFDLRAAGAPAPADTAGERIIARI